MAEHHHHDHEDHQHDEHGHDHHHGHHHHSPPKDFNSAFAIGIALNVGIVVMQTVYGLIAHSTALLADAGHNLSDVLSLVVAWGAAGLAKRPATARYTYGLRGSSIIAALFNAVFLLVVLGGIAWEAIRRFAEPVEVHGTIVMTVAAIGIVINGISAWLFASGRKGDINVRGAYLHMLSDAVVSFGVVCAGGLIILTGWTWLDPAVTLIIVGVIVHGTWGLLRDSWGMALAAVPRGIEPDAVRAYLSTLAGVKRIHDLHIWPMSTTETALTCHLVVPDGHPGDGFTMQIAQELRERFKIGHSTIQVELGEDVDCSLADHAA
ncbi:MAG: cation transporter [Proteobacteria bacterium]|nr:cation transporter [Pseudomonadota bacterium]